MKNVDDGLAEEIGRVLLLMKDSDYGIPCGLGVYALPAVVKGVVVFALHIVGERTQQAISDFSRASNIIQQLGYEVKYL